MRRRQIAWIGQGVTIEGKIVSHQDIRIDGHVEGTIEVGEHEVVLAPAIPGQEPFPGLRGSVSTQDRQ